MEKIINNEVFNDLSNHKRIPTHIDFNNERYIIIHENEYNKMQESIKNMDTTIINYMIEKEIAKEMPKDFDDVYIVVKNMLKNINKEHLTIYDIQRIIKETKTNYPNLFINIEEYLKEMNTLDF
ncbi:DUF2603 domain-containing protein [Helicobacter sp. MIT 14-3879]|uniref:DUF2603 domain-containing protein n=1 Tax=Helicobacter sp. MIT 14-3879 TaxID=2040649 RepID=UPI000E1EE630|nr:DUF2603 domain-containing protein [Helicobacter sp. MIT 14-3879]RDU65228.1 hypothetical protein CQA44_02630 [Helicobacter sp. MIT 14-3879]